LSAYNLLFYFLISTIVTAQDTNTNEPMKIYAITPAFDAKYLQRINEFFDAGHDYLQLRDKSADADTTFRFIEKVVTIADSYPHAKVIINATNNFEVSQGTAADNFNLAGIHQSVHNKKSSIDFCPQNKFNFLSCHNRSDLALAVKNGFSAVTLSPVYYTLSHPEQLETLGFEQFSEICSASTIPVYALGGVTGEMAPQFKHIKGCTGIAMIRGWFSE